MKHKVTITFTLEPREYGVRGDKAGAVEVAHAIFTGGTDLAENTRVRFACGKHVRYFSKANSRKRA